MEIDTETVLKIARLSRIKINESESADIQKDLNRIVEFVKKLGEIDIAAKTEQIKLDLMLFHLIMDII